MSKTIDNLNARSDKFTIILNDNELKLLKNSNFVRTKISCADNISVIFIAVIFHDKDQVEDDNNRLKTPHYHLVVQFDRVYRCGTMIRLLSDLFKINENQITIDKCNSMAMQCRYLTHLDDFDKYQYNYTDISCNDYNVLSRYYNLKFIRDIHDMLVVVHQYNYDLEQIMLECANYDKYRKYILDVINFHRRSIY